MLTIDPAIPTLCKILNFPPKSISVLYQLPLIFSTGVSRHPTEPLYKDTVLLCPSYPRPFRGLSGRAGAIKDCWLRREIQNFTECALSCLGEELCSFIDGAVCYTMGTLCSREG